MCLHPTAEAFSKVGSWHDMKDGLARGGWGGGGCVCVCVSVCAVLRCGLTRAWDCLEFKWVPSGYLGKSIVQASSLKGSCVSGCVGRDIIKSFMCLHS